MVLTVRRVVKKVQSSFTATSKNFALFRSDTCIKDSVFYGVWRSGITGPPMESSLHAFSPCYGTPLSVRFPRVHARGGGLFSRDRGGGLLSLCPGVQLHSCRCRFHPGHLFSNCRLCLCSVCLPLLSAVAGQFCVLHLRVNGMSVTLNVVLRQNGA